MTVPVVLLTGFLGSGKTTLLNQLLAEGSPIDGKLAVIVNEFGAVGIDGDLLPADMSRQVELPGGCVCCVLDDDLGDTMIELLAGDPAIQLIIIETTGIAEPLPIAWTLAGERLAPHVRLASIVTTVDVVNHARHRPMSPSVDAQVADADILALTKIDLAPSEEIDKLCESLRELNSHAPVLTGTTAELATQLRAIVADPSSAPQTASQSVSKPLGEPAARHEHIESASVSISVALDFEELTDWLQELPESVLRIKGVADGIDVGNGWETPVRAAFHRVGARVSIEQLSANAGGEPRLVAVGYDLNVEALRDCIRRSAID